MNSERKAILIIGYGNELRSDDALGRHVARELSRHAIQTIDVHQLVPELADPLSRSRLACFIDASAALPPGEIRVRRLEVQPIAMLDHHLAPAALINLCRELYGHAPRAVLITAGGESFEMGIGLSSTGRKAFRQIVRLLMSLLQSSFCVGAVENGRLSVIAR